MDVASAKTKSVDRVKVRLMQIPETQQLAEEKLKSTGAMDSGRTLFDCHAVNRNEISKPKKYCK